jgi:polyferredoxin
MQKLGYPDGLIRYSTQNAIDGKTPHVVRARVLIYAALLTALLVGWTWGVTHRSTLIVDALRDRNALYSQNSDGTVENSYTIKLVNKENAVRHFRVRVETNSAGITLQGGETLVEAAPEEVISLPVVAVAPEGVNGRHAMRFVVEQVDGDTRKIIDSSFFGPMR